MLALSKFLSTAVILAASASVMASSPDSRNPRDEISGSSYVASPVAAPPGEGLDSFNSSAATASHVTRLNRVLWEKSFEHGSNASTTTFTASPTPAQTSSTAWGHLKVGYGGVWPVFSNSLYGADIRNGLYRKPGIGACLLAALAITGLAVSRRRTGHHPIVPPRPTFDARISANGVQ